MVFTMMPDMPKKAGGIGMLAVLAAPDLLGNIGFAVSACSGVS